MSALRRDAENAGAQVVVATPIVSGKVHDGGIVLRTGGPDPTTVLCRAVVNAAGLWAQDVARKIEGVPPSSIPGTWLAKGHYFVLAGKSPFFRLVYPVPVAGGLGVHVTMDSRRTGALRSRCLLGRIDRLRLRRKARDDILSGHSNLLPPSRRRGARARLHRDSSQARRRGNPRARLRDPGARRARGRRAGEPLRDRIARAHRGACARRRSESTRGRLSQWSHLSSISSCAQRAPAL